MPYSFISNLQPVQHSSAVGGLCQFSYLHYRTTMHLQQSRAINDKYAIVDSQLLGKGSTGNVYLGFLLSAPQARVAIKAINLREIDNEVTRYLLSCEIAALSNLGKADNTAHENVVRLLDVVIQGDYIYLVTELLEGGTLAEHLKRTPNGLPEEEALLIFRQILEGYRHIRSRGVVHRDLKPDNVLFKTRPDLSRRVAIIDFGYCEMAEVPNRPQMFYNVGSPKYMAPEAYVDNLYSEKSDVWALGVIFYEMLVGKTCDQGLKMEAYLDMLRKNGIPLPSHLSPFARHLLNKMLAFNHHLRTDSLQLLKELDNYQSSAFQGHASQAQVGSNQFNESANEFYNLRTGKNNPVFKSVLLGQSCTLPQQLLQSQIQPNILIHEPPTNIPPDERNEPANKRIPKSNSSRNVQKQMPLHAANGPVPVLTRVENAETRENIHGKRMVEVKSCRPNIQATHVHHLDASFPAHRVHFNVVPAHNHREHVPVQNITPRNAHPHVQHLHREQRFMSNSQPDENSIKISINAPSQRFTTAVTKQAMLSIEKVGDNRMFHSPARKHHAKVQFFTEKKMRDEEPRHFEVRPFNGEVVRGGLAPPPMLGLVPLFH